MESYADNTLVSDILVNNVESLYSAGSSRTIAAFADLAQLCQAAAISEKLFVSPAVFKRSTLLQQLDCVYSPEIKISDDVPDSTEGEGKKDAIEVDVNEKGLFSNDPIGEFLLLCLEQEMLQSANFFVRLLNPYAFGEAEDRGQHFINQLPTFLFILQFLKNAVPFESEEAREEVLKSLDPAITGYRNLATRYYNFNEKFGSSLLFSSLEQSLADSIRVEHGMESIRENNLSDEIQQSIVKSIAQNREQFFEQWNVPPLGLMILGMADNLEQLPKAIGEVRDIFDKMRKRLNALQKEKHEAINPGNFPDDSKFKVARSIDQNIKKALEEYNLVVDKHKRSKRIVITETVFSIPKFWGWIKGPDLSTFSEILEFLNVKGRCYMNYISGLRKAASFVKACDSRNGSDILRKYLGKDIEKYNMQRNILDFALQKGALYANYGDGNGVPDDDDVIKIDFGKNEQSFEIPSKNLWFQMVAEESLRDLFLKVQ